MKIESLQKVYDDIAMDIFTNIQIKRDGILFSLSEIEVYLKDPTQSIDDVFIHKHEEQKRSKGEYFHYSGVDLCRGKTVDDEKSIYCGVLIRGVYNDDEIIYGPGRVAYSRPPKLKRDIQEVRRDTPQKMYFNDEVSDIKDLKTVIFKLPRVNLGYSTIVKKKLDDSEVHKYLNLKARYFCLIDEEFNLATKKAPAEIREIFNTVYEYQFR